METETNHIEVSTPDDSAQQTSHHEHQQVHNEVPKFGKSGKPSLVRRIGRRNIAALVVVLVLVAFGAYWSWWLFGSKTFNENKSINNSEFQAVFLTNGQVYFGKLADLNHKYVTITDIYYLQVQQSNGSLQNASGNANSNSQVSLAKLGSELHGPEDKMSVSSDQILFWENLKSDSKVVQAIQKYQNQ